jgi:hypothetical protein
MLHQGVRITFTDFATLLTSLNPISAHSFLKYCEVIISSVSCGKRALNTNNVSGESSVAGAWS